MTQEELLAALEEAVKKHALGDSSGAMTAVELSEALSIKEKKLQKTLKRLIQQEKSWEVKMIPRANVVGVVSLVPGYRPKTNVGEA